MTLAIKMTETVQMQRRGNQDKAYLDIKRWGYSMLAKRDHLFKK